MRPRYERTEDRERQAEVARRVADAWHCEMVDMPEVSVVDYTAVRNGKVTAIIEVKCRDVSRLDHKTYLFSDRKASDYERIASLLRVKPILVVAWRDAVGWIDLAKCHKFEMDERGRTDRNDPADIERCRMLPIKGFKLLWEAA